MTMTLITAVPGGGKTAYAVWFEIKKAHEAGRVVYTCGIPKLKIPTIELTYEQVKEWFTRDESKELPELQNIEHGSLLVVDEVQKLWPAYGKGDTHDIRDLTEHRHFGLSWVLITQSPTLLHRNVLALIDRHLHIRPTWAGRKIYEWPEYCRNPSASSNKQNAIDFKYKLPTESFKLYHSATEHIKPKKRIPKAFYVFFISLILTAIFIFYSFSNVIGKTQHESQSDIAIGNDAEMAQPNATTNNTQQTIQHQENTAYEEITLEEITHDPYPTVVSKLYDWSRIAACLFSASSCVCYGYSGERLAIPLETCKAATQYGWSGRENVTRQPGTSAL